MSWMTNCGEVIRSGDTVAILDTKAYGTEHNPLLASMHIRDYAARIALAKELGDEVDADPRALFTEQPRSMSKGEMYALGAYIGAAILDAERLVDVSEPVSPANQSGQAYNSVIAFENMRGLGRDNPYMRDPASSELVNA
jgi:hypothetical protein